MIVFLINPGKQMASARNNERTAHISTILMSISQNIADNRGSFACVSGELPTTTLTRMASSGYNIAPCLVPAYIADLPFDPSLPEAGYLSETDYNSGYDIIRNATTGRITINAPGAELEKIISVTR